MRDNDYLFKILVLGGRSSGKKSLIRRYSDGMFYDDSPPENQYIDLRVKTIDCQDKTIKQMIQFNPVTEHRGQPRVGNYRSMHYFFVCWDLTNVVAYRHVKLYLDQLEREKSLASEVFIVGTKSDGLRAAGNSVEEIQQLAIEHDVVYLGDTSARDGTHVTEVFEAAVAAKLDFLEGRRLRGESCMIPQLKEQFQCLENPLVLVPKRDIMLRQMTVHCLGDMISQVRLYRHISRLDRDKIQCLIQKKDSNTQKTLENFALTYALGDRHMCEGNAAIILIDVNATENVCLSSLLNNMRKLQAIKHNDHYNVIFLVNNFVAHPNLPQSQAFRDCVFSINIALESELIHESLKHMLLTLRDSQCEFGVHTTKEPSSFWEKLIGPSGDRPLWRPGPRVLLPLSQGSYTAIVSELEVRIEAEQREQQEARQEYERRVREQRARVAQERQEQERREREQRAREAQRLRLEQQVRDWHHRAAAARCGSSAVEASIFTVQYPTGMEEPPAEFQCPITYDLMNEPVVDPEGHSYEHAAILEWISTHHTSPVTRTALSENQLAPNRALRGLIERWKAEHPQQPPASPTP